MVSCRCTNQWSVSNLIYKRSYYPSRLYNKRSLRTATYQSSALRQVIDIVKKQFPLPILKEEIFVVTWMRLELDQYLRRLVILHGHIHYEQIFVIINTDREARILYYNQNSDHIQNQHGSSSKQRHYAYGNSNLRIYSHKAFDSSFWNFHLDKIVLQILIIGCFVKISGGSLHCFSH